jgi:hypothetical protein
MVLCVSILPAGIRLAESSPPIVRLVDPSAQVIASSMTLQCLASLETPRCTSVPEPERGRLIVDRVNAGDRSAYVV